MQADGKIIQGISGAHYPAVRRFFANGALDTTFGVKGYAELHYATEGHVVVLPGGKILACFGPISNNYGCYIARLTSKGVMVLTFIPIQPTNIQSSALNQAEMNIRS